MAVEQWEIDLRKLLEDKAASPKPTIVVSNVEKPVKPSNSWSDIIFMVVALILLGGIILFALDAKSGDKLLQTKLPKISIFNNKDLENKVQRLEDETHEQFTALLKKFDKLSTNLDAAVIKTNLMGFLLNENFMIVRDNKDKNHLIFFKRDWKLNHAPQYLKISDEDLQYLQKYISDEN